MDHVFSADVDLIFRQFDDFKAELGDVLRLLVLESYIALNQVLEVHPVGGFCN